MAVMITWFQGRIMEPQPVVSIEYFQETSNPWPRIMWILGVLTLVLGVCYMATAMFQLGTFSVPTMSTRDRYQLWFIKSFELLVGIVLVISAAIVVKQRRANMLMLAGAWGAVVLWIGQILLAYFSWGRLPSVMMVINGMLYVTLQCIFPLLIIMLLWQHKKEGSPNPRPQP
jgi:hypothetical protein